jgi:hypothetical protein
MISDDMMRVTWLMREEGLRRRKPRYILGTLWGWPLLLAIPVMSSNFAREAILAAAGAYLAFAVYAVLAYLYWRRRYIARTMFQDKGTVIVAQGYYGLTLLFVSLIFLSASLYSIQRVSTLAITGSLALLAMYTATFLVVAVRGKAMLRYIADHFNRPLAPEMRWMLGIPNAIVGATIALSAVFLHIRVEWVVTTAVGAILTFLSAPFAALTLYQVPLFLLWRGGPGSSS